MEFASGTRMPEISEKVIDMSAQRPEQRKAVSKFEKMVSALPPPWMNQSDLKIDHVTIVESFTCIQGPYSRKILPKDDCWVWHQSKSKTKIHTSQGTITLTKLSPKKKKNKLDCPSYKLWVYELGKSRFCLWCERGKLDCSALPPLVRQRHSSEELKLSQLSFLKEFIDPELARQFGWIE